KAAVKPNGGVDAVCQQITGNPAAGDLHVQSPEARAALGQVFGNSPVLEELCPVMENAAEPAVIDELLGQGYSGNTAVIIPDHVGHARLLDRLDHFETLRAIHRKRFLA